jgi:hypothetical protein
VASHVEAQLHRPAQLGEVEEGRNGGADADRHVDEEHPAPRELRGQHAAEDRADRTARAGDRAPHAERLGQADPGERRHDDGERGGREGRTADALDGSGDGQFGRVLGEAAEQARPGEDGDADQVQAAAPVEVGGTAAEEQEPGEGEHVGVDHPLEARGAVVEVPADRGQGDVHDRDVEDHHELRHAGDGEDEPVGGVPVRSTGCCHFTHEASF